MSNIERELLKIREYIVIWITNISISNSLGLNDINKVSEGVSLYLLNKIYGYNLEDLNKIQINFPGIDLGDFDNSKIAFQVTSRTDNKKIKETLELFLKHEHHKVFSGGLKFFMISDKVPKRIGQSLIGKYKDFFDVKSALVFPKDIVKELEKLYYSNRGKFNEIRNFLEHEFGNGENRRLLEFDSSEEKLAFYRTLFLQNYNGVNTFFVDFDCYIFSEKVSTSDLLDQIAEKSVVWITGPSGCGKSFLAKKIALDYNYSNLSIFLEAKFYESDLEDFIKTNLASYNFNSFNAVIETIQDTDISILVVVDGINECKNINKLKLELRHLIKKYRNLKLLLTSQTPENSFENALSIEVFPPSLILKESIALKYSSNKLDIERLNSVLSTAANSLEASFIGELGSENNINNVSSFTIFYLFVQKKLGQRQIEEFNFMSVLGSYMSDKIIYSIPSRLCIQIMEKNNFSYEILKSCLDTKFIVKKDSRISFSHEMIRNFFAAANLTKSFCDSCQLIEAINSPKNNDKQSFILGSLESSSVLHAVIPSVKNASLLASLFLGYGGSMCKTMVERDLNVLLDNMELEIKNLIFNYDPLKHRLVEVDSSSLTNWTTYDETLIEAISIVIYNTDALDKRLFYLIACMDNKWAEAMEIISNRDNPSQSSIKSELFAASYVVASSKNPALFYIFKYLSSKIVWEDKDKQITKNRIEEMNSKRPLKFGQLYFLLVFLPFDSRNYLYPYISPFFKNWKAYPYHLVSKIVETLLHIPENDIQQNYLIENLREMQKENDNILLSTLIFEILVDFGALDNDIEDFLTSALEDVRSVLNPVNKQSTWNTAAQIFDYQFDHPYSLAYYEAINRLKPTEKRVFYQLALENGDDEISFFTTSLIVEAEKHLGGKIAPYLKKWTIEPIKDKFFPQASVEVFILAHSYQGRFNYPFESKIEKTRDLKNRSLFAVAELYYWIYRTDLEYHEMIEKSRFAVETLFDNDNVYVVETIYQTNIQQFNRGTDIKNIGDFFHQRIVKSCRFSLTNLNRQKSIFEFSWEENEIEKHAISLIMNFGNVADVDVLHPLVEHPILGVLAINAIKQLSTKN